LFDRSIVNDQPTSEIVTTYVRNLTEWDLAAELHVLMPFSARRARFRTICEGLPPRWPQ
jgi:hypothetical protein